MRNFMIKFKKNILWPIFYGVLVGVIFLSITAMRNEINSDKKDTTQCSDCLDDDNLPVKTLFETFETNETETEA